MLVSASPDAREFHQQTRNDCKLKCFYREMGHPQMIALWGIKKEGLPAEVVSWAQRPAMIELEVPRFDDKGVPSGFATEAGELV